MQLTAVWDLYMYLSEISVKFRNCIWYR